MIHGTCMIHLLKLWKTSTEFSFFFFSIRCDLFFGMRNQDASSPLTAIRRIPRVPLIRRIQLTRNRCPMVKVFHATPWSWALLRSTVSNARGKPHFIFSPRFNKWYSVLFQFLFRATYVCQQPLLEPLFINWRLNRYSDGFGACTQNCEYSISKRVVFRIDHCTGMDGEC